MVVLKTSVWAYLCLLLLKFFEFLPGSRGRHRRSRAPMLARQPQPHRRFPMRGARRPQSCPPLHRPRAPQSLPSLMCRPRRGRSPRALRPRWSCPPRCIAAPFRVEPSSPDTHTLTPSQDGSTTAARLEADPHRFCGLVIVPPFEVIRRFCDPLANAHRHFLRHFPRRVTYPL